MGTFPILGVDRRSRSVEALKAEQISYGRVLAIRQPMRQHGAYWVQGMSFGPPRDREMPRLKQIIFYTNSVSESTKELCEAAGYREELQRLSELAFYTRQLSVEVEHYENVIRQHFSAETGLRASEGVWKRLKVNPDAVKKSSPPPNGV